MGLLSVPVFACGGRSSMVSILPGVAVEGVVGYEELVDMILRPPHFSQRTLSLAAPVGDALLLCRGWNR
jgi:hypothetical protein